mmetsp:Transcript_45550/g.72858  ORF Transcript_45550/g.72858 Transcript_45550/m.72858 type:complete len:222 (-) Transcript_45550:468-1133(-)
MKPLILPCSDFCSFCIVSAFSSRNSFITSLANSVVTCFFVSSLNSPNLEQTDSNRACDTHRKIKSANSSLSNFKISAFFFSSAAPKSLLLLFVCCLFFFFCFPFSSAFCSISTNFFAFNFTNLWSKASHFRITMPSAIFSSCRFELASQAAGSPNKPGIVLSNESTSNLRSCAKVPRCKTCAYKKPHCLNNSTASFTVKRPSMSVSVSSAESAKSVLMSKA